MSAPNEGREVPTVIEGELDVSLDLSPDPVELVDPPMREPGRSVVAFDPVERLMSMAERQEMPLEMMERMIGLVERVQKTQAETAMLEALSEFQGLCSVIPHNRSSDIKTDKGYDVTMTWADLAGIMAVIRGPLRQCELSVTWDIKQQEGWVNATCSLQHVRGAVRTASFAAPIDSRNPLQSGPQRIASATTFAKRHSLVQVAGLVSADPEDDDGKLQGVLDKGAGAELVGDSELLVLQGLAKQVEESDVQRVRDWLGVARLADIPLERFEDTCRAFDVRIKQLKKAGGAS